MAGERNGKLRAGFLLLVFGGLTSYFFLATRANSQESRRLERELATVGARGFVLEAGLGDLRERLVRMEGILLRIDRGVNGKTRPETAARE